MKILHKRKIFNKGKTENENSTIGEIFIDGVFFCYVLEDQVREDGVKVYGRTAIPDIEYNAIVTMSTRFKRETVQLYNMPDYSIQYKGVTFTGVRVHSGNNPVDSHGCPIVAYNTDNKKVWGTAEKELTKKVKEAIQRKEKVTWKIEEIH